MSGGAGDRFWHSVAAVLGGTAVAQAIPLLGSLLIARLYAPGDFGVFAAWLGLAHLAAVFATGRFENALALETDGAPRRLAMLATLVTITGAGLLLLPVVVLSWFDRSAAFTPMLYVLFVPTALALAANHSWQTWAAADGRLRELTRMRITLAAAVTAAQIGAGLLWPDASALAAAQLGGLLLGLVAAARWLPLNPPPRTQWRAGIVAFWSARRRFPLLSLPADGINSAAAQLPLLIVGVRFGAEAAGHLALTLRVLAAPIALLGSAVLDVFRRRSAASWRAHGHCREDFAMTLRVLSAGALVAAALLALSAEPLFALAFGERWRASGTMALWLLPLFALRFVASPLSYLFYVAGKQHVDLVWQCVLLAMTLATLWLPADTRTALLAYSAGYSVMYLVYLGLSWRYSQGATA
jgi:O-antigen/teichoic acid export membrane protein